MIPGREIRLVVAGMGGGHWLQRNAWRLWRVMRVFYILMWWRFNYYILFEIKNCIPKRVIFGVYNTSDDLPFKKRNNENQTVGIKFRFLNRRMIK